MIEYAALLTPKMVGRLAVNFALAIVTEFTRKVSRVNLLHTQFDHGLLDAAVSPRHTLCHPQNHVKMTSLYIEHKEYQISL